MKTQAEIDQLIKEAQDKYGPDIHIVVIKGTAASFQPSVPNTVVIKVD